MLTQKDTAEQIHMMRQTKYRRIFGIELNGYFITHIK